MTVAQPRKVIISCQIKLIMPCEILSFQTLGRVIVLLLKAVSRELWAAKTWCVSCTLHLTSSILHLTKNVSYILHLDPCILHLASDKNSGLYLASCCSCAGLLCQLWQLGTQCQPTKVCYHAFVPNILWLLVFDCSCLEVWPFDREAWLVWLSLQWCELVFFFLKIKLMRKNLVLLSCGWLSQVSFTSVLSQVIFNELSVMLPAGFPDQDKGLSLRFAFTS